MNLYYISQTENSDYDTYDSAVVCAKDEEQARNTHPRTGEPLKDMSRYSGWVRDPASVSVCLIGKAARNTKVGVICASYNAG